MSLKISYKLPVNTELYCPGHVALPALGEDPGVAPDDRGQQGDLRRVRVHHLDLVRLDAQDEVSSLGRCHGIHTEPELYNGKLNIYLFICWNENKTFLVNFGWASLPWVNSSHLFWFWVMFPTERKGIFCVLWLLRTEDVSELDKWRGTSGDLRPVARTAPGARAGKVPGNSEICLCRFHLGQGRADLPCNEFLPALKKSFMCNV